MYATVGLTLLYSIAFYGNEKGNRHKFGFSPPPLQWLGLVMVNHEFVVLYKYVLLLIVN